MHRPMDLKLYDFHRFFSCYALQTLLHYHRESCWTIACQCFAIRPFRSYLSDVHVRASIHHVVGLFSLVLHPAPDRMFHFSIWFRRIVGLEFERCSLRWPHFGLSSFSIIHCHKWFLARYWWLLVESLMCYRSLCFCQNRRSSPEHWMNTFPLDWLEI